MFKNVNKKWFRKKNKKIKLAILSALGITSVVGGTIGVVNLLDDNTPSSYPAEYTYDKDAETVVIDGYIFQNGVVVGQTNENQITESSTEQKVEDDLTIQEQPISEKIDVVVPEDTDFVDQKVSFANLDVSQDISDIRSFNVKYEENEHFYTDEALAKYYGVKEYDTTVSTNYLVNGKVDSDKLRDTVLANNKAYLENTKKYTEYDSSTFNTIFNSVVETINRELNDNIDINELNDNLANFKILNGHIQANGYLTDDKVLVVNSEYVTKIGGTDFLSAVAEHETVHLLQAASVQETQKEGYKRNTGLYYEWEDLKVNPLANQWFVEGAAERIMNAYNTVPKDLVTYPNNVKSIDSLTLSSLVRSDVDELTIPRLTMQQNFDKLFEIFNCQTGEDKAEVVNMLFSFEIIYNTNQAFNEASGRAYDYNLNYSLSSSICQTLTKNFYTNLYHSLENGEENLSTIFSLISVFEQDMNRITKFYDTSKYEFNKDFLDMYVRIQDQFFERVSTATNIDKNEIYGMYSKYYKDVEQITSANSIDSEELGFVNNLYESREEIKANNILSTFRQK